MHSRIRQAAVVALALALGGCATVNVHSYLERGVSLRHYRTYNWKLGEAQATGDPRLDNNRFFRAHVQMAIERQLANKGFEKTATPDLLVHYHASVTQRIYAAPADSINGYCESCEPEVFDAGTLLIDLVDAHTDRLVWRGWVEATIDGVIDSQTWMEQRIDQAVARILQKLPAVL